MRKLTLLCAALLVTAATATTALAGGGATGPKPTPSQCGQGPPVVNVSYALYNDADSGLFGNWATDSLNRHLQIFNVGGGAYCALINDTGSFVTTGPLSPELGLPLSAGIKGVINGGYVTTNFTATFDPSASVYATHGHLGSFDANLAHPSFLGYFDGSPSWDFANWGWGYRTANNGNWLNAATGNQGDIAD